LDTRQGLDKPADPFHSMYYTGLPEDKLNDQSEGGRVDGSAQKPEKKGREKHHARLFTGSPVRCDKLYLVGRKGGQKGLEQEWGTLTTAKSRREPSLLMKEVLKPESSLLQRSHVAIWLRHRRGKSKAHRRKKSGGNKKDSQKAGYKKVKKHSE